MAVRFQGPSIVQQICASPLKFKLNAHLTTASKLHSEIDLNYRYSEDGLSRSCVYMHNVRRCTLHVSFRLPNALKQGRNRPALARIGLHFEKLEHQEMRH